MENTNKSAAQIAREHNISPQLLRNRLKKGMSIENAVKECINVRDARAASGSTPHKAPALAKAKLNLPEKHMPRFQRRVKPLDLENRPHMLNVSD